MTKKIDYIKLLSELEYKVPVLAGGIGLVCIFFVLLGLLLNDLTITGIGIIINNLLLAGVIAFYEYKLKAKK